MEISELSIKLALSIVVIVLFPLSIYFVLIHPVPAELRDIVLGATGVLSAQFVQVLNYWFGSSRSSAQKDQTINSLSKP